MPSATATANTAAVSSGETPATTPIATPPMAECEMPTPMNASRRSTTKKPSAPHTTPTRSAAARARCMKASSIIGGLRAIIGGLRAITGGLASDAFVVGDLAGQEVELAAVGLAERVAVHDLLGIAVHVHGAIDADQLVHLGCERHQVVRDRDHGEAELLLERAQQRVEGLLGRQVEADRGFVEHEQLLARAQRLGQHRAALLPAR